MADTDTRRLVHPDICHCVWPRSEEQLVPNLCPTRHQALMFISERLARGVSCCHLVRRPVKPVLTSRPCRPSSSVVSKSLGPSYQGDGRLVDSSTMLNIYHDTDAEKMLLERLNLHTRFLDVSSAPNLDQRSEVNSRERSASTWGQRCTSGPEMSQEHDFFPASRDVGRDVWLPRMARAEESESASLGSRDQRPISAGKQTPRKVFPAPPPTAASTRQAEPAQQPAEQHIVTKIASSKTMKSAKVRAETSAVQAAVILPYDLQGDLCDMRRTMEQTPAKLSRGASHGVSHGASHGASRGASHGVSHDASRGAHPLRMPRRGSPAPHLSRSSSLTFGQLNQASQRLSRLVSDVRTPSSMMPTDRKSEGEVSDDDMLCDDVMGLPFPPSPTPAQRGVRAPRTTTLGLVSQSRLLYSRGLRRRDDLHKPGHDVTFVTPRHSQGCELSHGFSRSWGRRDLHSSGTPAFRPDVTRQRHPHNFRLHDQERTRTFIDIQLADLGHASAGSWVSDVTSGTTSEALTSRQHH